MPAKQNFELPQQLVDMQDAKTVGDLLEIAFPVAVGKIDTKRLATYADTADMRMYDPMDEYSLNNMTVSDVRLTRQGHFRSRPSVQNIHPSFGECAAITRELERLLLKYRDANIPANRYRLNMEGRANPFPKDTPGFIKGPNIHADLEDCPPNGRRYLAQSETPTLFVSHDDTLRALKKYGYDKILGCKVDPKSYDLRMIQHFFLNPLIPLMMMGAVQPTKEYRGFRSTLREALKPAAEGTLTAFTGITFHSVPPDTDRGRVLFEAEAHNAAGYRYFPDPTSLLLALYSAPLPSADLEN